MGFVGGGGNIAIATAGHRSLLAEAVDELLS